MFIINVNSVYLSFVVVAHGITMSYSVLFLRTAFSFTSRKIILMLCTNWRSFNFAFPYGQPNASTIYWKDLLCSASIRLICDLFLAFPFCSLICLSPWLSFIIHLDNLKRKVFLFFYKGVLFAMTVCSLYTFSY